MDFSSKNYWINFVDKLNIDTDMDSKIPGILKDLCDSFGFGCGFVYVGTHHNNFHLQASHKVSSTFRLETSFNLANEIGENMIQELSKSSSVMFIDAEYAKSDLEKSIRKLFDAKSMILVPTIGKDKKLIALVGLIDRRTKEKTEFVVDRRATEHQLEDDFIFARSIINILSNYIKMEIYRQQAESAQVSLEGTLDNMGIDVYVNDFETHEMLYMNRSMAAPYGKAEDLVGNPCWQVLYDDKTGECDFCPQKNLIDEEGNPSKVYSWDYKRPFDGSWFRVFSAAFRWVDGRMAHIVSSVDITENKRNEELIRQFAEFDLLTGLPNRYNLTQFIDENISKEENNHSEYYILFFDLDGFKAVNDTMGHKAGDELLRQISKSLQDNPLTSDRTYRYGGDEFIVVVDKDTPGTIDEVISSIRKIFSTPWQLDEGLATVGASIGISHYPYDDLKTGELIRKADQAMYHSKQGGKGKTFYYNEGNINDTPIH